MIPDFIKPIVWYRGPNAAEKFIHELQHEAEKLCVEYITPQEITGDDEVCLESAQVCHICQRILVDDGDHVRDHCQFTGTYWGAAHNACNINYHIKHKEWKLPVVIHNLKGYHGHLIVKALKSEFGKMSVIPQNIEKYLSLSNLLARAWITW